MGNQILYPHPRQMFVTLAICKLSDHATELLYNNYKHRVIILSDTVCHFRTQIHRVCGRGRQALRIVR